MHGNRLSLSNALKNLSTCLLLSVAGYIALWICFNTTVILFCMYEIYYFQLYRYGEVFIFVIFCFENDKIDNVCSRVIKREFGKRK